MHTENSHLCQVITTFSSGLTALNGLTSQVQYFAVGTSGTDFNISSVTDTHTFNLPTASAINRGALSSADWSAFNGKFNLPSLTLGSVLFSNGTTIAQDNANLFWDDSNNRLGIGTASPEVKLDVYGSGTVQSRIQSASGGDIRFSVDTIGRVGTYSNSSLSLLTNSVSRLIIDTAGNVGIGTSVPLSKLQINDTTAFSYSASPNVSTKIGTSGTGGSFLVNTPSVNSSYESGLAIDGTYTGGKSVININAFGVYSGGPYSADLAFKTSTGITLSEKMRITNAGDVGIGTTNPSTKLDVNGVITATGGNSTSWNAKQNAITLTTTGTSGPATLIGATLNIPQYGGGGGSTPVKLTSQTLTAASWTLVSGYYTYSFSNVNVTTTCDVSVTPQNASYLTAYNANVLPFVGIAAGVAIFYAQFPPSADMTVDIVITQTT
jgi:hypothetical protein